MKTECILDLMEEKGHINRYLTGSYQMPKIYHVDVIRGKEFGKKLHDKIAKDNGYLITRVNGTYSLLVIAKKEDIDEWIKEKLDEEKNHIYWENSYLNAQIFDYIREKGYDIERPSLSNTITFINLRLKKEREDEEKRKNQEAIDLLEQLL